MCFAPDPTLQEAPKMDRRENQLTSCRSRPLETPDCLTQLFSWTELFYRAKHQYKFADGLGSPLHRERHPGRHAQTFVRSNALWNGPKMFCPRRADRLSREWAL